MRRTRTPGTIRYVSPRLRERRRFPFPLQARRLSDDFSCYYRLEEASGNAIDAKGAVNLTDTNTVQAASGKVGNARYFQRANGEHFEAASNAAHSFQNKKGAAICWVYNLSKYSPGAANFNPYLSRVHDVNTTDEWELRLWADTDRYQAVLVKSGNTSTIALDDTNFGSPPLNAWHFLAMRVDAPGHTLYLSTNAGPEVKATWTGDLNEPSTVFTMGHEKGANRYHDGYIDEAGVVKGTALSRAVVGWLYHSGTGRSWTEIQSYSYFEIYLDLVLERVFRRRGRPLPVWAPWWLPQVPARLRGRCAP